MTDDPPPNPSDPGSLLEQQLATLQPAPLRPELFHQLATIPTENTLTLADRLLATTTTLGALAAAFILSLILWQQLAAPTPPRPTPDDLAARQKIAIEYQTLVATR